MTDGGKQNLLGVRVDAVDYAAAVERVIGAALAGRPYGVSALAVHGVMEAVGDDELRHRVNALDMATPDGQPVRWALNLLHRSQLKDRCYGPTLTLKVCERAAREGLPIFIYGSTPGVLARMTENLVARFPALDVAGSSPSTFSRVSTAELDGIGERIRASGARLVLVGLGCPRQEVFAYEMRDRLRMPILAVGAAFEYHAGTRREPPQWVQRAGLQWCWRLVEDPHRLWKRYATTNPAFVLRVLLQWLHVWTPDPLATRPPSEELGHA